MPGAERPIGSSVPLQALLYYNAWYSPCFVLLNLILQLYKAIEMPVRATRPVTCIAASALHCPVRARLKPERLRCLVGTNACACYLLLYVGL